MPPNSKQFPVIAQLKHSRGHSQGCFYQCPDSWTHWNTWWLSVWVDSLLGDALSAPFTSLFILTLFLPALFLISPTLSQTHPCLSGIEKRKEKRSCILLGCRKADTTSKAKKNGKKMIKKHSGWIWISLPADTGKEMTGFLGKAALASKGTCMCKQLAKDDIQFCPLLEISKINSSTLLHNLLLSLVILPILPPLLNQPFKITLTAKPEECWKAQV